jgi:hypothetical protein
MIDIRFPSFAKDRGVGFWLRPSNVAASQRVLRLDYSNEWRYTFGRPNPPDRVLPMSAVVKPAANGSYRIVILGDTGEGDRSQYGLVPLIRALKPQFMIINGDVAYPAGRAGSDKRDDDDFLCGFFEPYRNLGIPIWATAGNHEYYSPANGRDFHDVFCTRKLDAKWAQYGLPHSVLQPDMFWELRDDASKFVLIGLDTGKAANLDGDNSWWQVWKRRIHPDATQHMWLDDRLRRADANGDRVLLLFHIPALVNQDHAEEHLSVLHRIIAAHPSVKAVVCGHEHSFQSYDQNTFVRYMREKQTQNLPPVATPHYFVAGSSGAALASTEFKKSTYPSTTYPTAQDWRRVAGLGRIATKSFSKNVLSSIIARIQADAAADGDAAHYLSLLVVDVKPGAGGQREVTITPGLMDSLELLYAGAEPGAIIDVTDPNAPVSAAEVARCLARHPSVTL